MAVAKRKKKDELADFLRIDCRNIFIGERARDDLGNIEALVRSIQTVGLIHPPSVCADETLAAPFTHRLLAGCRRLTALLKIAEDSGSYAIPVRLMPKADDYTLRLIEEMENNQRKNLSVTEQIKQSHLLHEAMVSKYGKKMPGGNSQEGIGLTDTAKIVGTSVSQLSKDLAIQRRLDKLPEEVISNLSKLSSRAELERAIEEIEAKALAMLNSRVVESNMVKDVNVKPTPLVLGTDKVNKKAGIYTTNLVPKAQVPDNPNLAKSAMEVVTKGYVLMPDGDPLTEGAVKFLSGLESESADFMEIDPPYGIDFAGSKENDVGNYRDVDAKIYPQFINNLLIETLRVMKPSSWGVIWHATSNQSMLFNTLTDLKFGVSPVPGLWVKLNFVGLSRNPGLVLASAYEPFFYFRKGTPEIKQPGRSNVFMHTPVASARKIHETERPEELILDIFKTFIGDLKGKNVVIPFLGSGRTLITAAKHGMTGCGCDIIPLYRSKCILRASEELR